MATAIQELEQKFRVIGLSKPDAGTTASFPDTETTSINPWAEEVQQAIKTYRSYSRISAFVNRLGERVKRLADLGAARNLRKGLKLWETELVRTRVAPIVWSTEGISPQIQAMWNAALPEHNPGRNEIPSRVHEISESRRADYDGPSTLTFRTFPGYPKPSEDFLS